MSKFYKRLDVPTDSFQYGSVIFDLVLDRKERVVEWSYYDKGGVEQELESVGDLILGKSLQEIWKKSQNEWLLPLGVFHHIGRLLGFFEPRACEIVPQLVCRCFGIPEKTILDQIVAKQVVETSDMRKLTRAGSGCGSCLQTVNEFIQVYCDQNALARKHGARPKGQTSLQCFAEILKLWQEYYGDNAQAELRGMKGYTLYYTGRIEVVKDFQNLINQKWGLKVYLEALTF